MIYIAMEGVKNLTTAICRKKKHILQNTKLVAFHGQIGQEIYVGVCHIFGIIICKSKL